MTPADVDWKFVAGSGSAIGLGALAYWVRAFRARTLVSDESLKVRENTSKGGWITDLENKVADERRLRVEAEIRERETYALHRMDMEENAKLKVRVSLLTEKVGRQEKRIALITELLILERPDLAQIFKSSGFGDQSEPKPGES
jgi:hypothetical protein